MILILVGVCMVIAASDADRDDKKWVWDNNSRNLPRNGYGTDRNYDREGPSSRYEVFEGNGSPTSGIYQGQSFLESRPDFGAVRPSRPFPAPVGPQRPGGLYTQHNIGSYGQGGGSAGPFPGDGPSEGILAGPEPSWVRGGPFKEFDRCKCAAKFNCNSPGISYGHCDVGKQYCCYSTNKRGQLGGPPPSEPVHSIENGILVGPGGPVDNVPGNGQYPRPGSRPPPGRPGISLRPGANFGSPGPNFGRPGAGFLRPGGFGLNGGRPEPNEYNGNTYSPENGILVGPGGPQDIPNRDYGSSFLGRSAEKRRA